MKIKFKKQLRNNLDREKVFKKIESTLAEKRPKKIKRINQNKLEFETKNLFGYMNFHLYQNIDYGYFELTDRNEIKYTIVSFRIWLLLFFPVFATYFMLSNVLFSLLVGFVCFLFLFLIIYISHRIFFKRLTKNILDIIF